jgi:L-fuconolactonase
MAKTIDAHHHLWCYQQSDFGWIPADSVINRDFLPYHLHAELQKVHIDGTVAIQARQSLEETDWLLSFAANYSFLYGVVAGRPSPANLSSLSEKFKPEETRACAMSFR